jgi:pimeloyl-ACP methyl ester carboxylesterase
MSSGDETTRIRRDVTVRGVRMRVIEAGERGAPPLLLVHGFLASHASFDEVIDRFARAFHVVAPDLVGFGESEKPSAARYAYGIDGFTESAADVLAAFGLGRASVLGHGMGGAIALTLAARHAELVARLVLVDPLCYPHPPPLRVRVPLWPVFGPILFKQLLGRGMFRARFREDVFGDKVDFPGVRVDRYYDTFNSPSGRESAYAVLRAIGDVSPIVARVGRVSCPTLVVWGRHDTIEPVGFAARLAREIRESRLHVFETGHSPHEEQPEAFAAVVREFLEGRR